MSARTLADDLVQHIIKRRISSDTSSPYGYEPTKWITILILILYISSALFHIKQIYQYKTRFLLPTICLSAILEVIGWGARAKSSFDPLEKTPYLIQATLTVLAPTPLIGANFIIMGRVIRKLGPAYSRLNPRRYSVLFLSCDIFALLIQSAGGGFAASAASKGSSSKIGSNIILFGIIFQLVMVTVYIAISAEFYYRYFTNSPLSPDRKLESNEGSCLEVNERQTIRGRFTHDLKLMSIALAVSAMFIYIRSVYRTIELAGGWDGKIMRTQALFIVLEGLMIYLAMATFNVIHPGKYLAHEGEPVHDDVPLEHRY